MTKTPPGRPMSVKDQVRKVYLMSTRDLAGRHFTERYKPEVLEELERLGLIAIYRPPIARHQRHLDRASRERFWEVEVTQAGLDLLEEHPEHLPKA